MSKRKRYDWSVKRSKPYTATGIKRQSCAKCGEPAEHQWNICADGGLFRPLCKTCDVKLNAMVLAWVGHPDAVELLRIYAWEQGISGEALAKMGQDESL